MTRIGVVFGFLLVLATGNALAQDEPLPARVAQAYQVYETAMTAGDHAAALTAAATAWRAARDARIDPELIGILAENYGELALAAGEYEDAYRAWRDAAEISDRLDAPAQERATRWYRASLSAFARGELGDARQSSLRAAGSVRTLRDGITRIATLDPGLSGDIHYMIASTSAQLGRLRDMTRHVRPALDGFQASARPYDRVYANAYYLSGVEHFFWGDPAEAVVAFQMSRGINALLDGPARDEDIQTTGYWISMARSELGPDELAAVDARIAASDFPEPAMAGLQDAMADVIYNTDAVPVLERDAIYPSRASSASVSGIVLVRFDVTELGRVEDIQILAAAPAGVFEGAVERAMETSHYQPAMIDGQAVRREGMTRKFMFRMCDRIWWTPCGRQDDEGEN